MARMTWKAQPVLAVMLLLLCNCTLVANAACCTNGQPSYEGSELQSSFPLPTCSDGPCTGNGFSYSGEGAYESPNPHSCCDVENLGQFKYNPPKSSGKTWPWPVQEQFPEALEGTGQPCDPEVVKFRCKLGGHETSGAQSSCSAEEGEAGSCAAP